MLKSGTLSICHGRNLETRLPPCQGILKHECEMYLKQPLTPPQHKIIAAYRTSNHRLAIELGDGQLSLSLDIRLWYFCSYNAIDNEACFMLE